MSNTTANNGFFFYFRAALWGIKLSFSHQARLVTGNRMGTIEMIILNGHMGHINLNRSFTVCLVMVKDFTPQPQSHI